MFNYHASRTKFLRSSFLREEVDIRKSKGVTFKKVDVSNIVSVVELRNHIYGQQGQVDVLINNAGQYYYPAQSASEHFVQVQRSLDINYWGLKNVINAFLPMMSDTGRIVNMSSHLGHLCSVPGEKLKKQLGKRIFKNHSKVFICLKKTKSQDLFSFQRTLI